MVERLDGGLVLLPVAATPLGVSLPQISSTTELTGLGTKSPEPAIADAFRELYSQPAHVLCGTLVRSSSASSSASSIVIGCQPWG